MSKPIVWPILALFTLLLASSSRMEGQKAQAFEVATIKPVAKCTSSVVAVATESGRFSVGCQPLVTLIRLAYFPRIQEGNVTGGPKWVQTDLYDVVGKVDEAGTAGWSVMSDTQRLRAVQPYLQQLLTERFKLKEHTAPHAFEAYALVQAKGGAKLKEVDTPPSHQTADKDEADSTAPRPGTFRIVNNRLVARAVQIQNLLWLFAGRSGFEDAPAIDRTGLNGYYDFEMALPDFQDKAEFERRMNEQLGLRIAQEKVQLPTVVIDEAEKPSLDN